MSFIWPAMLLLGLAIPLGVMAYLAIERRRRGRIAAHGLLATGGAGSPAAHGTVRRRVPGVLMLVGLALLVVAMARPEGVVSVPRTEGTVILAFDVSGSMAADDLDPTRMEAAKVAARTFIERRQPSIRIGVVAFSDSGFSIQVPTDEQEPVLTAIDRLAPERGTSLGGGILTSLTTIADADADPAAGYYTNRSPGPTAAPTPTPVPDGTFASAVIVLLSDGENNQRPDPLEAAAAAADRGVRIFTVGIGSAEGATLEVEGFKVHSRLDEPLLRQIAEVTDGEYHSADDPDELTAIYGGIDTRLIVRPEAMEITSLVATAGLLVLAIGGLVSLKWLGRLP